MIESIYERHSGTLIIMAKGALEIRNILNKDVNSFAEISDIQTRLDDFYMSRIGIRMVCLIAYYIIILCVYINILTYITVCFHLYMSSHLSYTYHTHLYVTDS